MRGAGRAVDWRFRGFGSEAERCSFELGAWETLRAGRPWLQIHGLTHLAVVEGVQLGLGCWRFVGAATLIRAKAAASLMVAQTELSREDWSCVPVPPVVVAAVGASCGSEAMRSAPWPRVGPDGPTVGALPGMTSGVGLAEGSGPRLGGQSGSLSDPPVGLGLETASDSRPQVPHRPNAPRPVTRPTTGYKWVRRGCLDPLLGFPATTREVRRLAHSARTIKICPPPPPSSNLSRRW